MKPNEHIAAMATYALADFSVPHGVEMVSLAQNESQLTESKKLIDEIWDSTDRPVGSVFETAQK